MAWLRRVWQRIRLITLRQWGFGAIAAVVGFTVLMGVLYAWDYTNSSAFCGTTCHTMPPEYNAWQRSPHARVNCVECHIGRDFIATSFTRKAGDLKHVITLSTGQYKFPIYADSMLPASDACEKCHWPEKFTQDRADIIRHYGADEKNTLITTFLLLKVGGGTERQGQGYGIHWHIENKVQFITTDELKQNIPWIQVTDASGKKTVYQDVENPLTPDQIAKDAPHQMDCIDCHNRISHTFQTPEQAIDQGLSLNRIDPAIPFIKKKGVEVLSGSYKSFDDANKVIDSLDGYYSQNYADYYKANTAKVKAAIDYLKTMYQSLVFPGQELSWTTHPDNIGHKDSAGCFRCHDGKHLTADNKAIPLECNVCHTLPEVSTPGGPVPAISIAAVNEPDSHKTTTWLYEHRNVYNTTCQACHDTNNAGGKDNSSFCSNSACHGSNWKFVGLNAPALTKVFQPPVPAAPNPSAAPPSIPHPIGGNPDCQLCHSQGKVRPYPSDHIGRSNDVCLACHKPTVQPTVIPGPTKTPSATGIVAGPPSIPHDTAGRTQCLGCHGNGASGVPQVPQFHTDYGFANTNCLTCHKSSVVAPSPTVGAAPTSAPAPGSPPRIPASHAGRTGCLQCHVQGLLGAPKYPANHAGRTEDTCKLCHPGP